MSKEDGMVIVRHIVSDEEIQEAVKQFRRRVGIDPYGCEEARYLTQVFMDLYLLPEAERSPLYVRALDAVRRHRQLPTLDD